MYAMVRCFLTACYWWPDLPIYRDWPRCAPQLSVGAHTDTQGSLLLFDIDIFPKALLRPDTLVNTPSTTTTTITIATATATAAAYRDTTDNLTYIQY